MKLMDEKEDFLSDVGVIYSTGRNPSQEINLRRQFFPKKNDLPLCMLDVQYVVWCDAGKTKQCTCYTTQIKPLIAMRSL